jgi:Cytochrome c554 and c-prime
MAQTPIPMGARPGSWVRTRGRRFQAAALLLILASLSATGFWMVCLLGPPKPAAGGAASTEKAAVDPLFRDWPQKPDLVILLTGERHGYVLPCGCSRPQVGGVERLHNLVQILRAERGWPVTGLDLGNTPQKEGPAGLANEQGVLKYYYTMQAMKKVGFEATSFGQYEAAQPPDGLTTAIDQLFQDPNLGLPTVLACNLKNRAKAFKIENTEQIAAWKLVQTDGSKLKVGVIGAIGVDEGAAITKMTGLEFDPLGDPNDAAKGNLPETLKVLDAQKPDLRVLLYQGKPELAKVLAKRIPKFDVILCLSDAEDAPSKPESVGKTRIVSLGHKGKSVWVVGVWRTGKAEKPLELRYQMIRLTEDFLSSQDKVNDHPIVKLMEDYAHEVKTGDYLHKYKQTGIHPLHELYKDDPKKKDWEVYYVGSEKCKKCHEKSYDVWEHSKHAEAYQTLMKATRPSLRQYDAECIVCHTIGFTQKGGFVDADATPKLVNVGCESCHGPGSLHIRDKKDKKVQALMNPYKAPPGETEEQKTTRLRRLNWFCQKCHDQENDVNWDFDKRWPDVVHKEAKPIAPAEGEDGPPLGVP